MRSYIAIHSFLHSKPYPSLAKGENGVSEVVSLIKDACDIQEKKTQKSYNKSMDDAGDMESIKRALTSNREETIKRVPELVLERMKEYYKLAGIPETGISNPITNQPKGILPKFTAQILEYFANLDSQDPQQNKESRILKISGIKEIAIRFKHADSVIKKLVKLGFKDTKSIDSSYIPFFRGGALHDLIGIEFICSYPHQKEWLARSVYNFFRIPDRADYNLLYGFYTVDKESGYRGLHCDMSYFLDKSNMKSPKEGKIQWREVLTNEWTNDDRKKSIKIIEELLVQDTEASGESDSKNILYRMNKVFNIEIQIHTKFESSWAKMEHEKSYDLLTKDNKKDIGVTHLWKMLADNLSTMEKQFEHTQALTADSISDSPHVEGYDFIGEELHAPYSEHYYESRGIVKRLIIDLENHEISRRMYVELLNKEVSRLSEIINPIQNKALTKIDEFGILLQIAFILYSYSNHQDYFNQRDMAKLLRKSIDIYKKIIEEIVEYGSQDGISSLIMINAIIRYGRLTQKYGFGLIEKNTFEHNIEELSKEKSNEATKEEDKYEIENERIAFRNQISSLYETQLTSAEQAKIYLAHGLCAFKNLTNDRKDEYFINFKNDIGSYYRTLLYLESMAMDIDLNGDSKSAISKENKSCSFSNINDLIVEFRSTTIKDIELKQEFLDYITDRKITDTSLIVNFLSMMIRNRIIEPIDALEQIIIISAKNKISTVDLFYYEHASFTVLHEKSHYGNYHYSNMIYLLHMLKNEDTYDFLKARVYFDNLVSAHGRYRFDESFFATKYIRHTR